MNDILLHVRSAGKKHTKWWVLTAKEAVCDHGKTEPARPFFCVAGNNRGEALDNDESCRYEYWKLKKAKMSLRAFHNNTPRIMNSLAGLVLVVCVLSGMP